MENIARKERRRLEQTKRFRKAKRGAAIVGTAMVGCSVVLPTSMFLFTRISKNTDFIFLTFHLYYQKMSFRLQLFFYKNIGYSKRDHAWVLSIQPKIKNRTRKKLPVT